MVCAQGAHQVDERFAVPAAAVNHQRGGVEGAVWDYQAAGLLAIQELLHGLFSHQRVGRQAGEVEVVLAGQCQGRFGDAQIGGRFKGVPGGFCLWLWWCPVRGIGQVAKDVPSFDCVTFFKVQPENITITFGFDFGGRFGGFQRA